MATQPLETIPEESTAPAQAAPPARIPPIHRKQSPQRKSVAAWLLENDLPNATAWPVKQRKRQKQRPQNLRSPVATPRLSLGTPAQNPPATRS